MGELKSFSMRSTLEECTPVGISLLRLGNDTYDRRDGQRPSGPDVEIIS